MHVCVKQSFIAYIFLFREKVVDWWPYGGNFPREVTSTNFFPGIFPTNFLTQRFKQKYYSTLMEEKKNIFLVSKVLFRIKNFNHLPQFFLFFFQLLWKLWIKTYKLLLTKKSRHKLRCDVK